MRFCFNWTPTDLLFIVDPRYTHWILICLSIWLLSKMPHTYTIKCCVPNCGKTRLDGTILHMFPKPEKDPDRFRTWLYAIGGDILALENETIFKYRRVCHHHFQTQFHTTSNRLCANAVPTLNLPGFCNVTRRTPLQEVGDTNIEISQASSSTEEVSKPGTDGLTEQVTEGGESSSQIKRKKRVKTTKETTKDQEELLSVAKKLLVSNNTDDNMFGLYLNQQLKSLTNNQKIFAKKLMSDVLYLARTSQLNENSQIITSSQHFTTSTPIPYITTPQSHNPSPITECPPSQNSTNSSTPIPYIKSSKSHIPASNIGHPPSHNSTSSSKQIPYITSPQSHTAPSNIEHSPSHNSTYSSTSIPYIKSSKSHIPASNIEHPPSHNSTSSSKQIPYITSPQSHTPSLSTELPLFHNSTYTSSPVTFITLPLKNSVKISSTTSSSKQYTSTPVTYITLPLKNSVKVSSTLSSSKHSSENIQILDSSSVQLSAPSSSKYSSENIQILDSSSVQLSNSQTLKFLTLRLKNRA